MNILPIQNRNTSYKVVVPLKKSKTNDQKINDHISILPEKNRNNALKAYSSPLISFRGKPTDQALYDKFIEPKGGLESAITKLAKVSEIIESPLCENMEK